MQAAVLDPVPDQSIGQALTLFKHQESAAATRPISLPQGRSEGIP